MVYRLILEVGGVDGERLELFLEGKDALAQAKMLWDNLVQKNFTLVELCDSCQVILFRRDRDNKEFNVS